MDKDLGFKPEDVEKILEASKDELKIYAQRLGIKLDFNKKTKILILTVITALKKKLNMPLEDGEEGSADTVVSKIEYLKHPVHGGIFKATPILLRKKGMIPCDEEGNEIEGLSLEVDEPKKLVTMPAFSQNGV